MKNFVFSDNFHQIIYIIPTPLPPPPLPPLLAPSTPAHRPLYPRPRPLYSRTPAPLSTRPYFIVLSTCNAKRTSWWWYIYAHTSFVLLDVTCSPYGINRMDQWSNIWTSGTPPPPAQTHPPFKLLKFLLLQYWILLGCKNCIWTTSPRGLQVTSIRMKLVSAASTVRMAVWDTSKHESFFYKT